MILITPKFLKFFAGNGVDTGRDFTLYAVKDGFVKFSEKRQKKYDGRVYRDKFVHVVPASELKGAKKVEKIAK